MLPRKLKNLNVFYEGESFIGQVQEVVLPSLTRKMEEYRGGGMNAPIKTDHGLEALSFEWTCGGFMDQVLKQFGVLQHNDIKLRFHGAYQRDDKAGVDAVEITVQGRHSAIDMGTAKAGDESPFKVTTEVSYLKITLNDERLVEIDIMNMIEFFGDDDRMEPFRVALGI